MSDEMNIQTAEQTSETAPTEAQSTTAPLPHNKRKVNNAISQWEKIADEKLAQGDDSMWKEMIDDSIAKKLDENGNVIRDVNNRQVFRMSSEDFKAKYGFSRESARKDASERIGSDGKPIYSMNTRNRKSSPFTAAPATPSESISDTTDAKVFSVSFSGDEPSFDSKKPTSFQLYDDIKARLDNMYKANWGYSHRIIINQLLDEALKKYGF